jgi:hypothetical protein
MVGAVRWPHNRLARPPSGPPERRNLGHPYMDGSVQPEHQMEESRP